MPEKPFWLFDWFDEAGIRDDYSLEVALGRSSTYGELVERAEAAAEEVAEPAHSNYVTIAGRGLDFSGTVDCSSETCRRSQIDILFKRVWHYFDRIILADPVGHELRGHRQECGPEHALQLLRTSAPALLYLREIGAESLIEFRDKPCTFTNWEENYGKDKSFERLFASRDKIAPQIADEATITLTPYSDRVKYEFQHPDFPLIYSGAFQGSDFSTTELRLEIARQAIKEQLEWLVGDVVAMRDLRAPLTIGVDIHGRLLRQATGGANPQDVALQLHLPVLDGLPAVELIRFRLAESDSFERFRTALTEAIRARLSASPDGNPATIAAEIYNDLISPALIRITQKLRAAESTLARKATFGISLGVATIACGVLTGLIPVVATGVAAALTGAITSESKYLEEKRDIALEDMYFLWKAEHEH